MRALRDVSGKDAIKAFKRLGFAFARQRGSHVILRRGADTAVVPDHPAIRIGTLHRLLAQSNVTVDDFSGQL